MEDLCVSVVGIVVAVSLDSGCLVLYYNCSLYISYHLLYCFSTHFDRNQGLHCREGKSN